MDSNANVDMYTFTSICDDRSMTVAIMMWYRIHYVDDTVPVCLFFLESVLGLVLILVYVII